MKDYMAEVGRKQYPHWRANLYPGCVHCIYPGIISVQPL